MGAGEELAIATKAVASDFAESAEKFGARAEAFITGTAERAAQNGRDLDAVDQDISSKLGGAGDPLDGATPPSASGDPEPTAPAGAPTGPAVSPGGLDAPTVETPSPVPDGPDGTGAPGDGPGSPGSPGSVETTGVGPCGKVGEPIDIVGGRMVMRTVDASFDGVLPLVLRRAYASGYREGRLFGPGWSSTLDIRVVIGPDGVR